MPIIYAMIDPRTNEVKYIGQSKYQHMRYKHHTHRTDEENTLKQRWIDELKAIGLLPVYSILESDVAWTSRLERESHWVNHYLSRGHRLTNQLGRPCLQKQRREAYDYKQEKLMKLLEDM
jgi:hypothetical protein